MSVHLGASELQDNLGDLREQSLGVIAAAVVGVGYVWLLWVVLRLARFVPISTEDWLGVLLLTLSPAVAFLIRGRWLRIAAHLLVWSVLAAGVCAFGVLRSPAVPFLFTLPVILASVLLGPRGLLPVARVAGLFTIPSGLLEPLFAAPGMASLVPGIVIASVAAASWLSAHNVYTALDWTQRGYDQARRNEQIARERQAELRRALKSLDEATYRLERANYMLAVARSQAEDGRRLKQQFAQSISHELRTPLNLVVGFTELMLGSPEHYGGPLPASYVRDLSIVQRNARHLQSLVNDVLDLARVEAAQMVLLPEPTDPAALVREAVATARSLLEVHGLTVDTAIEPGLPTLWADPTRVRQVLYNLLNNAARFTERGGVTISVRAADDEVVFGVADTGIGIAPEDIPRLFDDFEQVERGTRRRHEGAGLGLAISRRFVEQHGGRIWVESQPGRGSTFYFSLPTAGPASDAPSGSEVVSAREPVSPAGEPVLLAITRSPSAAGLIARFVGGYRMVVARDLEQARQAAARLAPQAVVIDTAGEALDGAGLLDLGRSWGLTQSILVACPLPGEEPLRQHLAVDGYLIKPVSRDDVWDVLRQFGEAVDNIVVVDDDPDFALLMSRLLEDSPVRRHHVESAYRGRQALELLQHGQADLVFLDLGLPDMNGSAVIQHIRANPAWRHIPIVAVTGHDEVHDLQALHGPLVVTRVEGLRSGEMVQCVREVLDVRRHARPAVDRSPR